MTEAVGLVAAVVSALSWAISIVWFQAALDRFGPGACNLLKAVLGAAFFGLIWVVRTAAGAVDLPDRDVVIALAASGVIGFALGDLAFFAAMRLVGARLGTLLQSTYPLFLLAFSFFDGAARLVPLETLGVVLVVAGVLDVSNRQGRVLSVTGRVFLLGILAGLAASLGQAAGLLITDDVMSRVDVLTASAIRLGGAAAGLMIGYAVTGRGGFAAKLMVDRTFLRLAFGPIAIGTFLGISAMMVAIDLARPAPAGALMSLTPVFLVPLTTLMRGEHYDARVLIGTIVAVAGVVAIALAQA